MPDQPGQNYQDYRLIILYSVYFTDQNTGYVVGDNGDILKSTDGGTTWTTQNQSDYPIY